MKSEKIALACPYCLQPVIQLAASARPIQEQKLHCPSCKRGSKFAQLKTDDGNTFQLYMRQISPNVRVAVGSRKK